MRSDTGRSSRPVKRRLNPAIPEEVRTEALQNVLRVGTPALRAAERRVGKRGERGGRLKPGQQQGK